jgi:hypothetical protein
VNQAASRAGFAPVSRAGLRVAPAWQRFTQELKVLRTYHSLNGVEVSLAVFL